MSKLERQFTPREIEELVKGNRLEFGPFNVESAYFDFGIIKYVALTSFEGVFPIGICDFRYAEDTKNAVLESPIIVKRPDLVVPALDLRASAGVDGIFIDSGYRGNGMGSIMIRTAIEIARSLGAQRFIVNQPDPERVDWFKQLGGNDDMGALYFELI